eukprot:g19707.t1
MRRLDEVRRQVDAQLAESRRRMGDLGVYGPAAHDDVPGGDAPLPHGWSVQENSFGATYYINHVTGSFTWDRPIIPAAVEFDRGDRVDAPLPPDWNSQSPSAGGIFYARDTARPTEDVYLQTYGTLMGAADSVDFFEERANMGRGDAKRGLSSSELAMLPTQIGAGEGPMDQCSICKEPMTSTDTIVRLPGCKHTFHRDCIWKWLRQKPCCPLDMSTVNVTA